MNTINISKTTLARISEQAKKLASSSNMSLKKARDEVSKQKGYKSFNHARKLKEDFDRLPSIFVVINKKYEPDPSSSIIERYSNNSLHILSKNDPDIKPIYNTIEKIMYPPNKEELNIYKMSSLKIDLDKEREAYRTMFKERLEHTHNGVTYNKFHESHFLHDVSHKLYDYLQSVLSYNNEMENYYVEPSYFVINDIVLNVNGLKDDNFYP